MESDDLVSFTYTGQVEAKPKSGTLSASKCGERWKTGSRSVLIGEVNSYLRFTMSDEYKAILAEEAERQKRDFNEFDFMVDFGFLFEARDKTMPASVFIGIAGVDGSLFPFSQ